MLQSCTILEAEKNLWAALKHRVMGLAVLERSRKRQASRISYLKEGDANTKFFHLRRNSRCRKNHIQRLKHNEVLVALHDEKELHLHEHFSSVMASPPPRRLDFLGGH
jgi:hypothetical protein